MSTDDVARPMPRVEQLRAAMLLLALSLTYYVGVSIGLAFTPASHAVSLLWPPNAIVLAALLLCPPRAWIWPLLAVLPAHLISEVSAGVPLVLAASWYVSNVSEALLGAGIVIWILGEAPRFDRVRHVLVYLAAAVVIAPVVTSFLDASFVALVGWRYDGDYWSVVLSRLPSNALAATIIPPFAIIMFRDSGQLLRSASRAQWLEGVAVVSVLAIVSYEVFHEPMSATTAPIAVYAPLPLLIWAAVRSGVGGGSVCVAVLTLVSITGTLRGTGPFVPAGEPMSILSLQMFLVVVAFTLMLLAAALAELRKARAAALRNQARLNLALNAARLGTFEWRMPTDRISWQFVGRLGPILSGAMGSHAELLDTAHPGDRVRLSAAMRAAREQGENGDVEWRFHRNGRVRWIRGLGKVQRDAAGRPSAMIGIVVDVTRRKRQELQQRSQREKLAHLTLSATLGELSGMLTHEMSQPIAAIMLNARAAEIEAQKSAPDLQEVQAILADIQADGQRATEVIDRVRALAPKGPVEQELVQVADCIHSILALEHSDLIARNVAVDLDIDPQLPPVTAANAQLQQVLLNLIVNACEAMSGLNGQRQLRIAARHFSGEIRVEVSDNGSGIEDVERIFEPFFSNRKHRVGLGLSVARSIVAAHGGRLWGANNATGGATFFIALPITSPA